MSEDPALYGEPRRGPGTLEVSDIASALQTVLRLDPSASTELAGVLTRIAVPTGRTIESVTIGEVISARGGDFCAVGKVNGIWYALGQGDPAPRVRIGNGRRRTLTAAQLAAAARFETDLIARRAGRRAGFSRTYALPFPR